MSQGSYSHRRSLKSFEFLLRAPRIYLVSVWDFQTPSPPRGGRPETQRWTDLRVNQSPLMMGGTSGTIFGGFRDLVNLVFRKRVCLGRLLFGSCGICSAVYRDAEGSWKMGQE